MGNRGRVYCNLMAPRGRFLCHEWIDSTGSPLDKVSENQVLRTIRFLPDIPCPARRDACGYCRGENVTTHRHTKSHSSRWSRHVLYKLFSPRGLRRQWRPDGHRNHDYISVSSTPFVCHEPWAILIVLICTHPVVIGRLNSTYLWRPTVFDPIAYCLRLTRVVRTTEAIA